VALVDPLTNWILSPLHHWIFKLVRQIPQDGTFDQDRPLHILRKDMKKRKGQFVASADMTAATDRLPVILQEKILAGFFGKNLAKF
jgi:hypothetical protein